MGELINLDEKRKPVGGEFCLPIRLDSDGLVFLDKDLSKLSTKVEVDWAITQIAIAIHDLVEYKSELDA